MNGPRSTGPEYTGKHRRDSGPGVLPPAWARAESRGRTESYARPASDGRLAPGAASAPALRPESGFRPEPRSWSDAG